MLHEYTAGPKPGVGTMRLVGDVPEGQAFKVGHIEWGEYEDLTGFIHGPLTKVQCLAIMQAPDELHALAVIQSSQGAPHLAGEGPLG